MKKFIFLLLALLSSHNSFSMEKKRKNTSYFCPECFSHSKEPYLFEDPDLALNHDGHKPRQSWIYHSCRFCKQNFLERSKLISHFSSCPILHITLPDELPTLPEELSNLSKKRTNLSTKHYQCPHCTKTFNKWNNYSDHCFLVHAMTRPNFANYYSDRIN
jgi:hypothetical protein